ncbi:MAG TPA: hypothetical protein VIK89_04530, partial [Cytophagaceae bacterium]
MKKLLFYVVIAFAILSSSNMMAQQGFGTNTPDKSAAVDIVSTKRGFLMPRIALTATNVAAPVTDPANSLMVYNTATTALGNEFDVTPGFYFWDNDHWVRFTDADNVKTTTVSAGDGVTVTQEVDGNNTDFNVSITAGNAADMVMVTIANPDYGNPGEPEFITTWVSYDDLLDDLLNVENGLTYDEDTNTLTLGGALTKPTTITTDGVNTLTLAGLQAWDAPGVDGDLDNAKIVVLNADGTMRTVDYSDLVIDAENGLHYDADTNKVKMGGALTEDTDISTAGKALTFNVDATGSMAIKGLTDATAENTLVVRDANGVLHQVVRSASAATSTDLVISSVTDYSPYVPEVNIAVTLAATDVNVTLPAVADAKGQVINIRITNSTDVHDGYCNILLPGGGT